MHRDHTRKREARAKPARLTTVSLVAGVVMVALIAAGCTGTQPAPATQAPAGTEAPAATAASGATEAPAAAVPGEEKTLVYVTPSLAVSVDPCDIPGLQTAEIIQNLYAPWIDYRTVEGENGVRMDDVAAGEEGVKPGVIESWEVSDDNTVWTLHLRQDIVDSAGNPFKAEDAKWVFDRHHHKGQCAFIVNSLNVPDEGQVQVLDEYTLQVTLPAPNPIFLRVLTVNNAWPFGAATARHQGTADDPWASEWLKRNAPAIGPYMLESWTPGVEMVLVRNPSYFGPPPAIGRVIYRQVPEASNRVALIASGDAHVARDLSQEQLDRLDQTPGAQAWCIAANQWVRMTLNTSEGPTADPKVRQALAYAVPYQQILDSVYRGRAGPMGSYITPAYPNVVEQEAFPYTLDLDKAKQLLADAGQADGFDLTLTINAGFPEHERIAVLIRDSFAKIGINVQIDKKPGAAYLDTAMAHDVQATVDQNYAIVMDATYHAFVWIGPGDPPNLNFSTFTDEEFNKLLTDTVAMPEGPERAEKQKRIQEIVIEQVPEIPLANAPTCWGIRDTVTGIAWHTHNQLIFSDLDLSG